MDNEKTVSEYLYHLAEAMHKGALPVIHEAQTKQSTGPVNILRHWAREIRAQADRAARIEKELLVWKQATQEATDGVNLLAKQIGKTHGGKWKKEMFRDIAIETMMVEAAKEEQPCGGS